MRTLLRHWGDRLRTNLWFVPATLVLASVALTLVSLDVDRRYEARLAASRFLFTGGPEGASSILTAIAGSMIGVTGVIFSITVVALSLASTQFGPRLLRSFIRDRANQVVLGVFMGTFVFSLLALRAVEHGEEAKVPALTVNIAILLALLCLALLIFYVHHIATSIQADTIVAQVNEDLHKAIDDLYPEELGEGAAEEDAPLLPERFEEEARPVRARRTGYVQAIHQEAILEDVQRGELVVRLAVRPGDFVVEGNVIAWAWTSGGELDAEALAARVLVGRKPTAEQDAEFLLSQLVEVGVRALSPGINDPFTAIRCVDRVGAGLCHLAQRRFPSPARATPDGHVRIIARTTTWAGMVDAAFDQLRQNARSHVSVVTRLVESLTRVAECLPAGDRRLAPLAAQVEKVRRMAEAAGYDEADLEDVRRRVRRFEAIVGRPAAAQP